MAKGKLIKGFVHHGKAYQAGGEFEGSESEIETLTNAGYIKRKEGEQAEAAHAVDTGSGKGENVSASSSGSTGDSHLKAAAQPKIQERLARK